MTSNLYVALISPALLNTWHVYFPLCSGVTFLRLNVHLFFLPSSPAAPLCSSRSGRLSFSHTMSGRGLPLAVHFSLTELPTGRAMTRFRIFEGCVKRGGTEERESTQIRRRLCKICWEETEERKLVHRLHCSLVLKSEESMCLTILPL